jgi:DNA-binding winged helix-turn-helix (wHTH) protein
MDNFYKAIYQTAKTDNYIDWFQKTFTQICKKMQAVGFGQAKIDGQHLHVPSVLNPSNPLSTPIVLLKKLAAWPQSVPWGRIHGKVGIKTILVDHLAHTWLIDFTQVSRGPLLHDFTYLETQIKMHLLERQSLETLCEFEQQLMNQDTEDTTAATTIGKTTELIHALRHHAAYVTDCTPELYQLSLYYQGLNHLMLFDERRYYTQAELQPFVHLLLSTSMIASSFLEREAVEHNLPETAVSGLFIDEEKRQVYVEGQLITNLSAREYKLLVYFKQCEGQTRSRQEIVLEGFQEETYNEFNDQDRVNNAIKRLREKIEPDPQNPQFIITVPGQGYQFNSNLLSS